MPGSVYACDPLASPPRLFAQVSNQNFRDSSTTTLKKSIILIFFIQIQHILGVC